VPDSQRLTTIFTYLKEKACDYHSICHYRGMIDAKDKTFYTIKDFVDLDFNAHRTTSNAIQAKLDLGNGIQISVVSHKDKQPSFGGLYGDASNGTYEVAVFHNDNFVPLSPFDDVRGWQSKDDINDLMDKLQGNADKVGDCIDGFHLAKSEARSHLDLDSPHRN